MASIDALTPDEHHPAPGDATMQMLHDPDCRMTIVARLNALRPDSSRQWGNLTVDQMLWHVNPVSGKFASKLQAKHLDHHLRQFSA